MNVLCGSFPVSKKTQAVSSCLCACVLGLN